jgi:hypothetical protein
VLSITQERRARPLCIKRPGVRPYLKPKSSTSEVARSKPRPFHLKGGIRLTQILLRKEVIQPHLPIRLPCYDFTPVTNLTFEPCLLAVSLGSSGTVGSHGVTGGVYKARERIQRGLLIRIY